MFAQCSERHGKVESSSMVGEAAKVLAQALLGADCGRKRRRRKGGGAWG